MNANNVCNECQKNPLDEAAWEIRNHKVDDTARPRFIKHSQITRLRPHGRRCHWIPKSRAQLLNMNVACKQRRIDTRKLTRKRRRSDDTEFGIWSQGTNDPCWHFDHIAYIPWTGNRSMPLQHDVFHVLRHQIHPRYSVNSLFSTPALITKRTCHVFDGIFQPGLNGISTRLT